MIGENLLASKQPQECPYTTNQLVDIFLKTGEALGEMELYPYQIPLARRICKSILDSDAATITALFSRQCVDPNTLVFTPKGHVPIKDLAVNDIIYSIKDHEIVEDIIVDHWKTKTRLHTVTLENNAEITCSQDHRFRSYETWQSISHLLHKPIEVPFLFPSYTPTDDQTQQTAFIFSLILLNARPQSSTLARILDDSSYTLKASIHEKQALNLVKRFGFNTIPTHNGQEVRLPINTAYFNPSDIYQVSHLVLEYLLADARILSYSGNRGKKVKIVLPYQSTDSFKTELLLFLTNIGLRPEVKDTTIEFTDFQSLYLIHHFFKHSLFYADLTQFLSTYSNRFGHFLSPTQYIDLINSVRGLRSKIPNDSHYLYKKHGVIVSTIIKALEELGHARPHLFELLPRSLYVKVRKISSPYESDAYDIETKSTNTYVANSTHNHNSGKTETVACAVASMMIWLPQLHYEYPTDLRFYKFRFGFWVGIFAPVQDQADTMFSRIKNKLTSVNGTQLLEEFGLEANPKGKQINITNGSFTFCKPAGDNVNIESKTLHLAIADECQDLSTMKVTKSINPMCASTGGTLVYIGTSNTKKSYYFESIQFNRTQQSDNIANNHFEVDWEEAAKYNPYYKTFVLQEMERLGYDSDAFKMSYRNIFIFQRGMMLDPIQLEPFDLASNPKGLLYPYDVQYEYSGNEFIVMGLDIGKTTDSTVATALAVDIFNPIQTEYWTAYRKRILGWMEKVGDDHEEQYPAIVDFIHRYRVSTVVIDATGKGEPVYDRLAANLPYIEVIPFTFSKKSKHLLFKNFISDCNANRLMIPDGHLTRNTNEYKKFINQMSECEKEYNGSFISCHHPNVKGAHDDYVMSVALGCYAAREQNVGNVEVGPSPFAKRR